MEVKDFNIFNLSLQQKKLLKKKVGKGGGSDESEVDKAIFNISFPDVDGQSKVRITLIAGKPKLIDTGYGNFKLDALFFEDTCVLSDAYFSNYRIEFTVFKMPSLEYQLYRVIDKKQNDYFQQLNNLKVGEFLDIDKNAFWIAEGYSGKEIWLLPSKNFGDEVYTLALYGLTIALRENNKIYYGKIIEEDTENHFLYVSIKNEIWKYSYVYVASEDMYGSITFVEVVSELT